MNASQLFTAETIEELNNLVPRWIKFDLNLRESESARIDLATRYIAEKLEGKCENQNAQNFLTTATLKMWAIKYKETYKLCPVPFYGGSNNRKNWGK